MKVVILCGGKGTRLREETEYRPKPMVPIGNYPILWHIMKTYAHYGYKDFILCLGYKGNLIKDYFRNYCWHTCDITVKLGINSQVYFHNHHHEDDWRVTLANTGEEAMTAYRIWQIEKYLDEDEKFLLTYGDGLCDVNIDRLIDFHQQKRRICTITGVHPPGRFGELGIKSTGIVSSFNEKPNIEGGYINGGFMVCDRKIFDYITDDPNIMLENDPMNRLAANGELAVFKHEGFWRPMDTFHEFTLLNKMWADGNAKWKVWTDEGG